MAQRVLTAVGYILWLGDRNDKLQIIKVWEDEPVKQELPSMAYWEHELYPGW
ncbi:MAG: hypothetical protein P0Y55_04495 [Candidatus Cohnella colombiensis]|uniref:Uncharacterized protein n=1 Tax=Candidatus Cohnella colombiensis TaxID=3121368 RepID=A0AA95JCL9_9BACL|nr:MAG: hypothetical protein P0Y55_04495 [Cohnella sp.]